jgi:hypothetical protein
MSGLRESLIKLEKVESRFLDSAKLPLNGAILLRSK